jgi:hypothetical protein
MDVREILVANTKTQKRYKVNTDATTLGELKAALNAEGIDYAGMTFTEGISKTQLTSDDSQLPTNVMYKGQPTNNLVMLLTNTTKNIASGAEPLTRKEIYTIIRENNLSDDLKEEFGNWTIITTEALEDFIRNNYDIIEDDEEDAEDEETTEDEEDVVATHPALVGCLYSTIKDMYDSRVLDEEDVIAFADMIDDFADSFNEEDTTPAPRHHAEVDDEAANSKIDDILAGM